MELTVVNLEDLNLVELNAQEAQEVEGGTWPGIGWWMDVAFGYGGNYGGGGIRQQLMRYDGLEM